MENTLLYLRARVFPPISHIYKLAGFRRLIFGTALTLYRALKYRS